MEKERVELLTAIKRRNNDRVMADKMARTFAYRRQEVVNEEPGREDFKDRWPALFQQKEINTEFQRLMALPLKQIFLALLDRHSSQLIEVIQAKGGATCVKMAGIMRTYEEGEGLKEPPEDIGIVIEGVEVLHGLTSVSSACALLLGLIYALNLVYPKALRFTFEVFQRIFMQLEQHKMSPKVQNLFGRLQTSQ